VRKEVAERKPQMRKSETQVKAKTPLKRAKHKIAETSVAALSTRICSAMPGPEVMPEEEEGLGSTARSKEYSVTIVAHPASARTALKARGLAEFVARAERAKKARTRRERESAAISTDR